MVAALSPQATEISAKKTTKPKILSHILIEDLLPLRLDVTGFAIPLLGVADV